ncbi:hypothetical protein BJY01DRAFT_236450 [Aspergillus pseudoustus]|uniref:FAD-binding PCMH-type domain-containing protein n=1 Tax=Aspergillus pseudoustus TaxID=1810923 RepID=A0ABR4JME9_9EURO
MHFIPALMPKTLPFLLFSIFASTLDANTLTHCAIISPLLPGKERLGPACITLPTFAEDVATIVGTLAKLPGAVFAIRSGGHSPNPGFADTNREITIDLQRMSKVHVSSDGTIASLDVIRGKFDSMGIMAAGGISGLSLSRGWACDNVADMQVVLASGEIIEANDSNEYADLCIALKGGQNKFGISTEAQLAAYITFRDPAYYDPGAEIEQSFAYMSSANGTGTRTCLNTIFYAEPIANPSGLQPFSDIQPQLLSTMRIANATAFAEKLIPNLLRKIYVIHATVTFRFAPKILPRILAICRNFCRGIELTKMANLTFFMTFMDIPRQLPNAHNSLGFPPYCHPDRKLSLALFSFHWQDSGYSRV